MIPGSTSLLPSHHHHPPYAPIPILFNLLTMSRATTGIMKLSTDVLSSIFEIAVAHEATWEDFETPAPYSVMLSSSKIANIVSHVCQHWRTISADTASLWASPRFTYNQAEMDFHILRRAKRSPLKLTLEHSTWTAQVHLPWLDRLRAEFMPKVEQLRTDTPRWATEFLLQNAPLLRALSVNSPMDEHSNHEVPQIPLLSTLSLCNLPWLSWPSFQGVSRLRLNLLSGEPECMSDLARALHQMLGLVELVCFFSDCDENEDVQRPAGSIILPRLSVLTLMGDLICCTVLAQYIRYNPILDHITISEHRDTYANVEQTAALYPFVEAHTATPGFTAVRAEITLTNKYIFSISLHSAETSVSTFATERSEAEEGTALWRRRCIDLTKAIRWTNLRTLSLDMEDVDLANQVLGEVDAQKAPLAELRLASESSFAGFNTLCIDRHCAWDNTPLQHLCTLIIEEVRMIRRGDASANPLPIAYQFGPAYGRLGALLAILVDRTNEDIGLDKVLMKDCLFDSIDTSSVKKALLRYVAEADIVA
jgi:hypothetical protein